MNVFLLGREGILYVEINYVVLAICWIVNVILIEYSPKILGKNFKKLGSPRKAELKRYFEFSDLTKIDLFHPCKDFPIF